MGHIFRSLILLLLIVSIAACGGDDEEPTATPEPTSPPTATTAPTAAPTATDEPAAEEEPTSPPATATSPSESPLAAPSQPDSPLPGPISPLATPEAAPQASILFSSSRGDGQSRFLLPVAGGEAQPLELGDVDLSRVGALNWVPELGMFTVLQKDASGYTDYYLVDFAGNVVSRITNDLLEEGQADYSAQADRIVYVCVQSDLDLCTVNADGSGWFSLTDTRAREGNPSWSPDGKQILYSTDAAGVPTIWTMSPNGAETTNLSVISMGTSLFPDTSPSWSPDGTRIVFESVRDENLEVYVMDSDGGNATNLTDNPARDSNPRWSPDGKLIAFISDRDSGVDIYLLDLTTNETVNVTNTPGEAEGNYIWSPDSSLIVFDAETPQGYDIFSVQPDGSGLINLTDTVGDDVDPQWIGE